MTKYNVQTAFGTFKRSTENRTYSHFVVVGPVRADVLEAERLGTIAYERKQAARYRRVVETGVNPGERSGNIWDRQSTQRYLADGSYVKWAASSEALAAKLEADGPVTADAGEPGVVGWCSRLDLAYKLAAKQTRFRFVHVIDVATGAVVR
jgi:hypothetical protein